MSTDGRQIGVADVDGAADATPSMDALVTAVGRAGGEPVTGPPADLVERPLQAILTPGDAALRETAVRQPDAPLLPVAVSPGVRSVAADDLGAAVEGVLADDAALERHPILAVRVDGEVLAHVLREATLLTAEPARISEFAVHSDATGPVDEVRADGVVVATPAGSHGYAAAGGGPLLAPATGLVAVPVAPFRIDRAHWVLPNAPLTVTVRRDEAAVAVEADGTHVAEVGSDATLELAPVGEYAVLALPESSPTFRSGRRPGRLERH